MKTAKLDAMKKGWFVGNFTPTLYRTNAVEAAVKRYRSGDHEASHYHKIATEITVVVEGAVEMNGTRYAAGDIVVIEPGDRTDFHALTDAVTAVVKLPGANDDKYMAEEEGRC